MATITGAGSESRGKKRLQWHVEIDIVRPASALGRRGTIRNYLENWMNRDGTLAPLEVTVNGDLAKALRVLKRKMANEGVFKEMKKRRYFDKPSVRLRKKRADALRRRRKAERRAQQAGRFGRR
jgi:small subunit ribosomal protein S21